MAAKKGDSTRRHSNPKRPIPRNEMANMRWMVLVASLGLMLFAVVLRLQPSLLSKDTGLASATFGKVGIVLMCAWLAWPAVEMLWRAPSGLSLFVGVILAAGLFVYRPKTLYITGPFLAVAAILTFLLGWISRRR